MKGKRIIWVVSLLCIVSVFCVYAEGTTDTEVITMRLSTNHTEQTPAALGYAYFADRVSELTQGQVEIEVYYNAVLGSARETLEQIQAGALDITHASTAHLSAFTPIMDIFSVPYLFRNNEHFWNVLEGKVGSEIAAYSEEAEMKLLVWVAAGSRSFYNKVRPITKPEDLKGLKIRVMGSPVMIQTMETFGASPTTTAFAEVYSALQTGVIDGAENNPISVDKMKHDEVSDYYSMDEHMMIPDVLMISLTSWNKLSDNQQKKLLKASDETQIFIAEEWAKQEKESLDNISSNIIINEIPDKTAFIAVVKPLQDSLSAQFDGYIEKIQAVK